MVRLRCPQCKTILPSDAEFCTSCGDLAGQTVHVRKGTSYEERLRALQRQGIDLKIATHPDMPTEELIRRHQAGQLLAEADQPPAVQPALAAVVHAEQHQHQHGQHLQYEIDHDFRQHLQGFGFPGPRGSGDESMPVEHFQRDLYMGPCNGFSIQHRGPQGNGVPFECIALFYMVTECLLLAHAKEFGVKIGEFRRILKRCFYPFTCIPSVRFPIFAP